MGTMTILVVEDDDEIRDLVAELLRDAGFDVATAPNGELALAYLADHDLPTVMVLDLMMPIMDGWEVRKRMLADPALAAVPVIVVSGTADLAEAAENLRAVRIFTKPVRFQALLDEVRAHG